MGALRENAERILSKANLARQNGASVVVFPELALSGYPPEDLIMKHHFVEDCQEHIQRIAPLLPADLVTIVGCPWAEGSHTYNTAIVLYDGTITGIYHKILLPNYGVFDEKRVFQPGIVPKVINMGTMQLGLHICEDSWILDEAPLTDLRTNNLDALINLSASPYYRNRLKQREKVMSQAARFLECPLLYCNLVGGQDELVFDGASMAFDSTGDVVARAKQFEEDMLLTYIEKNSAPRPILKETEDPVSYVSIDGIEPIGTENIPIARVETCRSDVDEVYSALKTGLRDYVQKNQFQHVVVALSGGIDSALVITLAVDALGSDRVSAVTMPSRYSSNETQCDAKQLAKNIGVQFSSISIESIFENFLKLLQPTWTGHDIDTTEENIQARIRGTMIMALSNKFNWLVLATGNKSEMAVGYCTLYGDMAGGFSVLKDVPKTLVFELCRWRNKQSDGEIIPASILERPPSAELRENQQDTDNLPPYDRLDAILEAYVEKDMGLDDMIAHGFDADLVSRITRMVDLAEYKRRQAPPGIKITPKAFGKDRRIPITNAYREHGADHT